MKTSNWVELKYKFKIKAPKNSDPNADHHEVLESYFNLDLISDILVEKQMVKKGDQDVQEIKCFRFKVENKEYVIEEETSIHKLTTALNARK